MTDDLLKMIVDDTAENMTDAVAHSRREFATVRTGRASSSLVERLTVEAYGVEMRMQELASFSVPEARQLLITPHDPANVPIIERTINQADLGLAPSTDGRTVRLVFPELTEERRRDLVRMVNGMAEEGKNRLRGLRRHARKDLDDLASPQYCDGQEMGGTFCIEKSQDALASNRLENLCRVHTRKFGQCIDEQS